MVARDFAAVPAGNTLIRNEPVQARSTARLTALMDAAAAVIDRIGYERLTTAMVADGAGASIGTVYRYFPDRIAVLQALAARNYARLHERLVAELDAGGHKNFHDARQAVFDVFVEMFRTEPGFRSLRVGDVLDLRPAAEEETSYGRLGAAMLDEYTKRFQISANEEARFAFNAAIEVTDALVARAFARDDKGDERYLKQGRTIANALLEPYFD
ncbi:MULTISPECIES: TetR/AcrR family transcriptional regulator [unclassified Diaminobutyricimonas]|uniref:TetR/AcrR family transcriptional regulator n=1 Tax=unclassified Diaminobutyricimonas TaxID=2643261 RepID=UPI001E30217E|nr:MULTISPECIES: TetR/AcrR family transcriptional regulator [unclassified Diaminobutyricimonas]